jgi:hypothetical protein
MKTTHTVRIKRFTWHAIKEEIAEKPWVTPTSFIHEAIHAYLNGETATQTRGKPATIKNNNNKNNSEKEKIKIKRGKVSDLKTQTEKNLDFAFFYSDGTEESAGWVTHLDNPKLYSLILTSLLKMRYNGTDTDELKAYFDTGCVLHISEDDVYPEPVTDLFVGVHALVDSATFQDLKEKREKAEEPKPEHDSDPNGVIAAKHAELERDLNNPWEEGEDEGR